VTPQATTTGSVDARVYLAGRDRAGLTAYATAVSTPGNKLYGKYLSPAQVQSRYGATGAQVAAIKKWLSDGGLKVTSVQQGIGGYVAVTGSLAAANKAFGVTFANYQGPDHRTDRAPQQAATAPSSVASAVLTVTGLDTARHLARPADTLPPPGPNYWVAPPTSTFYGQQTANDEPTAYGQHWPWAVTGYTPAQVRGAYGVANSGMTGRNQTVAIVDAFASPTMQGDANQYARVTGDPTYSNGQYRQYLPSSFSDTAECDAAGWYGEQTLDVESVHGQAPDANIRYVAGASCQDQDLDSSLAYIVNHHLASIVSNSWGEPFDDATDTSVLNSIFQAGAAEGIGFFFSSGDSGYESPAEDPGISDQIQVDSPAASPWVTSVGGTSLAIGANNNYEFETSWGTILDPLSSNGKHWQHTPPGQYPAGYGGSGGGGVSTVFPQPAYQRGVVPSTLATQLPDGTTSSTPMRVEPDVAAYADPATGFLVGQTTLQPDGKTYAFSLSRIGGTSVACPTMAGIQADAQQAARHDLGFANPQIYARYGTSAFRDVTDFPFGQGQRLAEVRNNYTDPSTRGLPLLTYLRTLGINGEGAAALPAVHGYDDATGVGSPQNYVQSFAH
jgi:subtilase family serine protease